MRAIPCRSSSTWTAPAPKACGRSSIIWKANYPEHPLAPRRCGERRASLRWLDWAMGPFHEQVTQRIVYEKAGQRFTGAPGRRAPDMNVIRAGREELKLALAAIGQAAEANGNLAGRAPVAGRSGGGGASVGAGLFRRSAVERISRRRGMVCADEIAAQLPLAPGRPRAGPAAGRRIMPNSISDIKHGRSIGATRRAPKASTSCASTDAPTARSRRQPRRAARLSGRRPSWRHGLDGRRARTGAPIPRRCGQQAKSVIVLGLNYGPDRRSAGDAGAQGSRRDLGLCAGRRLSRCREEEAEGGGGLHLPRHSAPR